MWEVEVCDACGGESRFSKCYGKVRLCKKCAVRIGAGSWASDFYPTNEEVEKKKEKVLRKAKKLQFSEGSIGGLAELFDSQKVEGLIVRLDGREDQIISVFESYFEIDTDEDFSFKDVEDDYRKAMGRKQFGSVSASLKGLDSGIVKDVAKNVLSGVARSGTVGLTTTLIKTGAGLAGAALASSVEAEGASSGGGIDSVRFSLGARSFDYSDFAGAEFIAPPTDEGDTGFILFRENALDRSPGDRLFCFSSSYEEKARKVCSEIQDRILFAAEERKRREEEVAKAEQERKSQAEAARDQLIIAAANSAASTNSTSVPDEIMKFKQLLDSGAITQEEFDQAKRRLLEM